MEVIARCPACRAGLPVPGADVPGTIACGRCGRAIPLAFSASVREGLAVDRCPVCSGADFYSRKDFDPQLGLAVIIAGAVISAGFYWFGMDMVAYGVLGGVVLLDLVVYRRLGWVTSCYRCHTEFRGSCQHTAAAFDLHTADVLEREYDRRIGRR